MEEVWGEYIYNSMFSVTDKVSTDTAITHCSSCASFSMAALGDRLILLTFINHYQSLACWLGNAMAIEYGC